MPVATIDVRPLIVIRHSSTFVYGNGTVFNRAVHVQYMKSTNGGKGGRISALPRKVLVGAAAISPNVPRWKRVLDITVIAMGAPAWLPLMLGISAGIKCLSRGPVLFRQERVGLGGRRFVCLKFRSMHTGAKTVAHEKHLSELIQSNRPMTKLDGRDPRLIPLAWVLRSTGLDELPQLFNVLRGEMSLVGPRPCTPQEYGAYSKAQRTRSGTLPGLTGLWQVSGKNRTTFNEMIDLDICYARTLCLTLDLAIMLRTPVALMVQVAETVLARMAESGSSGSSLTGAPERNVGTTVPIEMPLTNFRRTNPSPGRPRREAVLS